MVAIKVFYGSDCRRSNKAPNNLSALKDYIFAITGLQNPIIQYRDEEDDLISIYTDEEYKELLESSSSLIKLTVLPSKIEQSSETFPIKKEDSSSSTIKTIEQSIGTREVLIDRSESTTKAKTSESGCSPQEFSTKKIETVPFKMSSVEIGTPEILTSNKFTKTKNNLLESIRGIIREELGSTNELKVSGIFIKHDGIICSQCKTCPIIGIRYKCSECSTNFCESCEYYFDHEHPFFKVKHLNDRKESFDNKEAKNSRVESKDNQPVIENKPKISKMQEEVKNIIAKNEIKKEPNMNSFENCSPEIKFGTDFSENLAKLMDLGIADKKMCLEALIACNNILEDAIDNLF